MKATFALAAVASLAVVNAVEVERNPPPGGDVTILQYALTLEHLEDVFYHQALAKFSCKDFQKAGYPAWVRQRVEMLAADEAAHVAFLTAGLTAAGVKPTEACKYSFPYKTVDEFLALSRTIEGVGVSAYLGAAGDISLADYVTAAGSILTIEARHNAVLSELQGQSGFPGPFDTPLGYSEVYTLAAGFIKSCPPTNPTLPVQAFPALTVRTADPQPKKPIDLVFNTKGHNTNGELFMHVLNGLNDFVVPISARGHSRLPANIAGRVYLIVSTSESSLSAGDIIAGPAIVDLVDHSVIPSFTKKSKGHWH